MNVGTHRTILLVEDDANDVLLVRRAFSKAGTLAAIAAVADGQAAVDYLSGNGGYGNRDMHPLPALVLLDLKLPRKSGHEVLQWLRGHARLKRLPVVILTSSQESSDVNRAYDLGANSYLVKPVAFDSLYQLAQTLGLYWLVLNQSPVIQ